MSRFRIERSHAWKFVLGAVGCAMVGTLFLQRASAQSTPDECALAGKNCSFTISDNSIQKVPTLFKLQAQIAQAKIPVGDAVFTKLVVNIKSGNTVRCTESFDQVRVRSGVLNIEIGRNIQGCDLDTTVARYNDLTFQVCIGDSTSEAGNCLKPIQFSSVPYAIKASFASQAQESYRSEISARANYAQRLVADGTRLDQTKLGIGYYDFETPGSGKLSLLTAVNPTQSADVKGGFLQWTPVDSANKFMNFSTKNPSTGNLEPFTKLLFHAGETNVWGKFSVVDTAAFQKEAVFGRGLSVLTGNVSVNADATFQRPLTATNTVTTGGMLTANGGITAANGIKVNSGTLDVASSAAFGSTSASTAVTFRAGTTVDMSAAAQVILPTNTVLVPSVKTLTASSSASCVTSAPAAGTTFCAISLMTPLATGVNKGCWIGTSTSPAGRTL
ncbi:MAG TPA: hypothetical protein VFQ61_13975, partial [Polyangiaceae bacterium]|nr:hypothetical protein [Polyangiaceae bacterium]